MDMSRFKSDESIAVFGGEVAWTARSPLSGNYQVVGGSVQTDDSNSVLESTIEVTRACGGLDTYALCVPGARPSLARGTTDTPRS